MGVPIALKQLKLANVLYLVIQKERTGMNEIKSIVFTFKDATYNALVRLKRIKGKWARVVTIMNGELETLLFGNHFFFVGEEHDTVLNVADPETVQLLRQQIAAILQAEQPLDPELN